MSERKASCNPKWDIYEAVILLDGYLKAVREGISVRQVSKDLSGILRQMAANRGISIDDSFRNISGLSFQIRSMESAFKGKTISIPASALFKRVVKLYHEDKTKYRSLLREARSMISNDERDSPSAKRSSIANPEDFLKHMNAESKIATTTCSAYVSCIRTLERYAKEHSYSSCRIFGMEKSEIIPVIRALYADKDFLYLNAKQHNRFSAAISQLMKYLEIQKWEVASNKLNMEKHPVDTYKKKSNISSHFSSDIERVLKEYFKYGFKKNSIREIMKFRRLADGLNVELPYDDNELQKEINLVGTVIEDKVFCVDNDIWLKLQKIVNDIYSHGAKVIFYETLFNIHLDLMLEYHIASAELLRSFLQVCISDFYFAKNFISYGGKVSEKEAVTAEIIRVWDSVPVMKIEEISAALPYLPVDYIRRAVSGNTNFVWTSEGEYLYIDLFDIPKADKSRIIKYVDEKCKSDSFVPLMNIPLESLEDDNPNIPLHSIYSAIYNKILSDKYCLNGKILTLNNNKVDVTLLLKQYILEKEECTFDEVAQLVVELTGSDNRQLAFNVLYDNMVRINKKRFVSLHQVDFDIDAVDQILSDIIGNQFCAIKEVTTFALFPFCGQGWNFYLLESYCYKFSHKYDLRVICFNDKNAGIIAEKRLVKKYDDLLAIHLAKTTIELVPDVIGKYLYEKGLTAKSKYTWLSDLADKAQELRKEFN